MQHQQSPLTEDAREAEAVGDKPDLGRRPDAMNEALSGSNVGSDTRAGSLRGGSAAGSEHDPDQEAIDEMLATEGMVAADQGETPPGPPPGQGGETVRNTGEDEEGPGAGQGGEADAATG